MKYAPQLLRHFVMLNKDLADNGQVPYHSAPSPALEFETRFHCVGQTARKFGPSNPNLAPWDNRSMPPCLSLRIFFFPSDYNTKGNLPAP